MKKRIALVLHGSPAIRMGGTGMYVDALAHALADQGHPVAIVSPAPGESTDGTPLGNGVEGWKIGLPPLERWSDTWNQSIESWQSWCLDWKPDVVHVHHLSGWPLALVGASPCTTVLTLHDYAIPCARGQLVTGDLVRCDGPSPVDCSTCLAPALRTNPLTLLAGRILAHFPRARDRALKAVVRVPAPGAERAMEDRLVAARQALDSADVLLSPSHDLADRMEAMGFRRPIHTELPLLHPAPTPTDPGEGPTRFLFASTIIPTKGPDLLLDAWDALNADATLTIAGHEARFDERPDFAATLRERALRTPRVTWCGPVEPSAVPELMNSHDVLVLPSRWPENSPLVIREATAHGLRVIANKTGGARELAPHATLVDDSIESLCSALQKELSAGRKRVQNRCWPSVREHSQSLLGGPYTPSRA